PRSSWWRLKGLPSPRRRRRQPPRHPERSMIALDTNEEKSSPRLWIFAGIVALALHVGGAALAIVQLRADIDGGSLGAQGTEIGIDLTSLGTEVTDLPPGPESEAVQATPPAPDQ